MDEGQAWKEWAEEAWKEAEERALKGAQETNQPGDETVSDRTFEIMNSPDWQGIARARQGRLNRLSDRTLQLEQKMREMEAEIGSLTKTANQQAETIDAQSVIERGLQDKLTDLRDRLEESDCIKVEQRYRIEALQDLAGDRHDEIIKLEKERDDATGRAKWQAGYIDEILQTLRDKDAALDDLIARTHYASLASSLKQIRLLQFNPSTNRAEEADMPGGFGDACNCGTGDEAMAASVDRLTRKDVAAMIGDAMVEADGIYANAGMNNRQHAEMRSGLEAQQGTNDRIEHRVFVVENAVANKANVHHSHAGLDTRIEALERALNDELKMAREVAEAVGERLGRLLRDSEVE